jgi:hypothetical protein
MEELSSSTLLGDRGSLGHGERAEQLYITRPSWLPWPRQRSRAVLLYQAVVAPLATAEELSSFMLRASWSSLNHGRRARRLYSTMLL